MAARKKTTKTRKENRAVNPISGIPTGEFVNLLDPPEETGDFMDSIEGLRRQLDVLEETEAPLKSRLRELELDRKDLEFRLDEAQQLKNIQRWYGLVCLFCRENPSLIDLLAPEHYPAYCGNEPYSEEVGLRLCPRCTLEKLRSGSLSTNDLSRFVFSLKVENE